MASSSQASAASSRPRTSPGVRSRTRNRIGAVPGRRPMKRPPLSVGSLLARKARLVGYSLRA